MKITKDIIKEAADSIARSNNVAGVRAELSKRGFTEKQVNDIIVKAKEKIKADADDVSEIQKELNIYRLNLTATDNKTQDKNKLTAIDILNKLNGLYTEKIKLDREFKFVLGDVEDDVFLKKEIKDEEKRLDD